MIDTNKYEGHQLSEFKISVAGQNHSWVKHQQTHGSINTMFVKHATAELIADAPILLAEIKRLRKEITALNKWADNVREYFGDEAMIDLYDIYGGEEE
jgi:hypothetical protein